MANQKELRRYAHSLQNIFVDRMFVEAEEVWRRFQANLGYDHIRINSELRAFKENIFKCIKPGNQFRQIDMAPYKKLMGKYDICSEDAIYRRISILLHYRVPTIKFLMKELSALQKEFNDLELTNNKLMVSTNDIELEGIYFGPFRIAFNIRNILITNMDEEYWAPWVQALNPQRPGGNINSPYVHPHVNQNSMCLGDGYSLIYNAAAQGRIFDYFQLVNVVLNTYGLDNGPFMEIEAWSGVQCGDCSEYFDEDCSVYCDSCLRYCCYDCATKCEKCEIRSCAFCSDMLHCDGNCDTDRFCESCLTGCQECEGMFCDSCLDECSKCNHSICHDCLPECQECNNIFCDSCLQKCSQCNHSICGVCLVECKSCYSEVCSNCNETCDSCSSNYHSKCAYVCCEDE